MTAGAGIYLLHGGSGSGNAHGIVVGLLISLDDSEIQFPLQVTQGPFQNSRFAGAGRTYQVQNKHTFLCEEHSVPCSQPVIFGKDICFHAYCLCHGSIVMLMFMFVTMGMGMSMIMFPIMLVLMLMLMVVMMLIFGSAATCCTHILFYLQFFYS
jgi:hypothetical protein